MKLTPELKKEMKELFYNLKSVNNPIPPLMDAIDALEHEVEVLKKCLFQAQEASIYFIGQIDTLKNEIKTLKEENSFLYTMGYKETAEIEKQLTNERNQFEEFFLAEHDENVRLHTENEEIKNEIKSDPYVSKANHLEVVKERDCLYNKLDTLFDVIKHGDEAHQAWLKNAIETHFKES